MDRIGRIFVAFNIGTVYYNVTNAFFQSVFWVKYIVRHVIEVHKSRMPCFSRRSLLLSTIVLNDTTKYMTRTYVQTKISAYTYIHMCTHTHTHTQIHTGI